MNYINVYFDPVFNTDCFVYPKVQQAQEKIFELLELLKQNKGIDRPFEKKYFTQAVRIAKEQAEIKSEVFRMVVFSYFYYEFYPDEILPPLFLRFLFKTVNASICDLIGYVPFMGFLDLLIHLSPYQKVPTQTLSHQMTRGLECAREYPDYYLLALELFRREGLSYNDLADLLVLHSTESYFGKHHVVIERSKERIEALVRGSLQHQRGAQRYFYVFPDVANLNTLSQELVSYPVFRIKNPPVFSSQDFICIIQKRIRFPFMLFENLQTPEHELPSSLNARLIQKDLVLNPMWKRVSDLYFKTMFVPSFTMMQALGQKIGLHLFAEAGLSYPEDIANALHRNRRPLQINLPEVQVLKADGLYSPDVVCYLHDVYHIGKLFVIGQKARKKSLKITRLFEEAIKKLSINIVHKLYDFDVRKSILVKNKKDVNFLVREHIRSCFAQIFNTLPQEKRSAMEKPYQLLVWEMQKAVSRIKM